jgi:hypothetical protein
MDAIYVKIADHSKEKFRHFRKSGMAKNGLLHFKKTENT